jgi:hypothetical protein
LIRIFGQYAVYVLIPEGFTREVDTELRRLWKEGTGYDDHATRAQRCWEVEAKIANIRPWREKTNSPPHRAASARPLELITERDPLRANLDASKPQRTFCGSSFDGLETLLHICDRDFSPHFLSDLKRRQHLDLAGQVIAEWKDCDGGHLILQRSAR